MTTERLGRLQLAIMRVLWERGESSASDVHAALWPTHRLAPTTIATMLRKMENKGVIEHRHEGRKFVYRPKVSESDVTHSMVADLAERLFEGSVGALACHLLDQHEVDPADLDALRRRIDAVENAHPPVRSPVMRPPAKGRSSRKDRNR